MRRVTGNGWHLLAVAWLAGACLLMPGLVRSYGLARPVACLATAYLALCAAAAVFGKGA